MLRISENKRQLLLLNSVCSILLLFLFKNVEMVLGKLVYNTQLLTVESVVATHTEVG